MTAGMSSDLSLPYRVLIVDDVPEVRKALRWALENESDLIVVGEAGTGVEALTCATTLAPDVVILDIELPTLDGYAVTRALKASAHPPVVVFLTMHGDLLSRQRASEASCDGFAEKARAGRRSSPEYAARLERKKYEIGRLPCIIMINNHNTSYLKSPV
jgi:DNA-binding NarL/FixJ family response regulator